MPSRASSSLDLVVTMSCGLTLQVCLIIALSLNCCRRWRFGFVIGQVSLAWSTVLSIQIHILNDKMCRFQISWLLQKPTDLDLHCLHRQGISRFSRTRVKLHYFFFSTSSPDVVRSKIAMPCPKDVKYAFRLKWLSSSCQLNLCI